MTQTLEKELDDRMEGTSEQVQTGNILEVPGGKNRTVTDSHTLCVSRTCESGDASSINVTNKNVTPVVNTVNPRAHAGGNATAPENQTQPTITIDPEIRSEEDTKAANNQNQCVNGSNIREDENVTVNREQNKTIRRTEAMIEDGSNIPEEDVTSSRSQPETIQPSVESANSNTGLDTKNLGKGKMKRKRELGESYMGRQLDKRTKTYIPTERMQKVLGNRCDCKASHHRCRQIADVRREEIHKETWSLSWEQKRVFVKTAVESLAVKQRKTSQESQRKASLVYYLKDQGGLNVRVCKNMFLATTGLTQWFVLSSFDEENESLSEMRNDQSVDHPPVNLKLKALREFLDSLPKMPSHYYRKDTKKLYVEPFFKSYADLYEEYTKQNIQSMSRSSFMKEIASMGISVFHPRKDRCDICCSFDTGNIGQDEYVIHRQKKDLAQKEKEKDKLEADGAESTTKVITVDVQRVLLAPCLLASALYYKTKLQVHNYSVFDLSNKDTMCYLWNEAEGSMSANEFASCLIDYLTENMLQFNRCIIFSDGCTYQNRNHVLASALRHFCKNQDKTVEQKFLERGHTQMEVDSVHATIEKKLKGVEIHLPSDYVKVIKSARKQPEPCQVKYLDHTFFSNYKDFGNLKSIKPGKKITAPNVTNLRALKYTPDGLMFFKTSFADDWELLPLPRNDVIPVNGPDRLYSSRLKIKQSKYDHLQSLKSVLLKDAHAFYDNLPH